MHTKNVWPRLVLAALVAVMLPLAGSAAWAQMGAGGYGKIHGSVTNVGGGPETSGTISLYKGGMSSATQTADFVLKVDENGEYHGDRITAGSYTAAYRAPDTPKDKVVDQIDHVEITPGGDVEVNFDMSTEAFISKLPAAEQKRIAETKKKNAKILEANKVIKSLNADLRKARELIKEKNFTDAAAIMQKDVALKPDAAVLWVELGIAQAGLKQWADAQTSLEKGLTLAATAKKPDLNMEGAAQDKLGEVLVTMGKIPEAQAAFDKAAQLNPTSAGMYYENETIMMDRVGQTDATVASADKAIAANPNSPIPYYLKARALITKATVDPKTQKIIAPPGCVEAYKKYLELAPTGQFANDAKQVLAEVGESQKSSYHAGRKHHR